MEPQPLLAAVPRSEPEADLADLHELAVDLRVARADLAVERVRVKDAARRLNAMAHRLAVEHRLRLDAEKEVSCLRENVRGRVASWPARPPGRPPGGRLRRAWRELRR